MSSSNTAVADAPGQDGARLSAEERAERLLDRLGGERTSATERVTGWWHHFRFIFFLLSLFLSFVSFWLGLVTAVIWVVRAVLYLSVAFLAWLGGAGWYALRGRSAPAVGGGWLRSLWTDRFRYYRILARPLANGWISVRSGLGTFWRWNPGQKVAALIMTFWLVFVPFLYIIPRPHYVQIIDDDALDHHNPPNGVIRYLVHAVDLFEPGKFHEYTNARAVHLGKIDPQGIKNEIVNGGYYKVWVIGVRWYWLPTLFPNIISATPVDAQGNTLSEPSGVLPPPAVGPWYPDVQGPYHPWPQGSGAGTPPVGR